MSERRIELGFEGGNVLRLTVDDGGAQQIVESLRNGGGWRSLDAVEGPHWINLNELCYVRLVPGEPSRVGFGGD